MKWETQHRSSSGFSSCLLCLRAPVSGPSGSKCRMLPRPPWGERGRASWLCRHVAPGARATPRCIYGRLLRGAVWEPGPDVTGTCPPPLAALVHLPQEDPGASSLPQDPEGLEAGLLGPLPHALAHGPQGTAWVSRAGSRGTGVLGRQQPHTQSPVPGPRLRTGLGSRPSSLLGPFFSGQEGSHHFHGSSGGKQVSEDTLLLASFPRAQGHPGSGVRQCSGSRPGGVWGSSLLHLVLCPPLDCTARHVPITPARPSPRLGRAGPGVGGTCPSKMQPARPRAQPHSGAREQRRPRKGAVLRRRGRCARASPACARSSCKACARRGFFLD